MRARHVLLLTALGLGGCSAHASVHFSFGGESLSGGKLEPAIEKVIRQRSHVVAKVSCPSGVSIKKGGRFTCTAHLALGTFPVAVIQTDNKGDVHFAYHFFFLPNAKLEREIAASILAQTGAHVTVRCPSPVLQRRGLNFSCTARSGSTTRRVAITQTGGGNVHFRLV